MNCELDRSLAKTVQKLIRNIKKELICNSPLIGFYLSNSCFFPKRRKGCSMTTTAPCPWEFHSQSKTKIEHDLSKTTLPRLRGQLGTLNNENVDVPDVKNGNRKLIFYLFQCYDSTNSYSGS